MTERWTPRWTERFFTENRKKKHPIFALEKARTGRTSAKSELSAFGLHCPCNVERQIVL